MAIRIALSRARVTAARARRRRRRIAVLTASAAAHLAVLALLAEATPGLLPPGSATPPVFQVALDAPPTESAGAPASAAADAAAAPTSSAAAQAALAPASAPTLPDRRPTSRPAPVPTLPAAPATAAGAAPAASLGPAAPAAAGQAEGRWRVRGGGDADAAARALARTTAGCDHQAWLHLTAAERDRCDRPFLEGMRSGVKIDALPAAKRAYYDQVQAAYAKMHEGAPLPFNPPIDGRYANLGVEERWAGPAGAHMPGLGCSPFYLLKSARKSLPPHALKLGPCVVTPPSGLFTEEADVRPPPTLREQEADAAHAAKFAPPPSSPSEPGASTAAQAPPRA